MTMTDPTTRADHAARQSSLPHGSTPQHARRPRHPRRRRRLIWVTLSALLLSTGMIGYSISTYVANSEGEPISVIAATWARDHGLGSLVAAAEDFYYAYIDTVDQGGLPAMSANLSTQSETSTPTPAAPASPSATASPAAPPAVPVVAPPPPPPAPEHLAPPANITSPAAEPVPDEGVWQPVGATVGGVPAVYATRVRPDSVYTSQFASMMWFDPKLTSITLVPGYQEPGGPAPSQGALPSEYFSTVLANFNGAFRLKDSRGGYYYQGTTVAPLRDGIASTVIYSDGRMRVGTWGVDVGMSPDVAIVRQNLNLIVDGGQSMVTGGGITWGATTHGENLAWRSAIGQRADGSIVYIGSPGLSAASMADTLVRAGVQQAMVLDMHDWWVAGFYFSHAADGSPVCAKLDPNIQEGCNRFLNTYKRDSYQVLARDGLAVGVS